MIPEMKERYIRYLERIVSLNPPTPAEVAMSRDLENYLKNDGCYLTDEDNQKREMVLEQLRKISKEWIRKMGRQQLGLEANGRLAVFGSYGMGLKSSGSDIDAILIGPKFVTRDHFFSSFVEELQGHPWIKSINPIPNARVPILKTEWKFGVEVDILYAAINLNSVPEDEDVECQERYRGIDEVSRLSLGGVRAMHAIKKAVSNWDEYVLALNSVKHWAKLRGLHSSNFGYLSGITLAIMVARATQLYPKANAFVLFKKIFTMFHFNEDYWYMHVCMLYLPEEDAQWDRTTKQEDAEDAAIVLMPCYPWTNTAKKATDANVAILIKEIRNAKTIIDGFENEADWEQLFCPIKFIDLYDLFLIVSLTEVDADRLKVSKGFLESRINYLLRALETKSEFTTLHIFPKSFEAKRNPNKLIWAIGVKIDEEFKEKVDLTNELRTFLAKFHYAARKCDVTIDSSSVDIEVVKQRKLKKMMMYMALVLYAPALALSEGWDKGRGVDRRAPSHPHVGVPAGCGHSGTYGHRWSPGGTFEALVDTGADLSVVDLRTALDTGHGISKLAKICAGPDGKKLDMVGSIFLNIKIDDETLSHNFVILKTHLRTLILGRDFLKKMNAKIDCKQETIKYDLTNNHDEINFEMLKIKSAKDSIVPECSMKLIKALVETEDGEYIIEESSKMFQTNGLRLARSLINVINRETHIWITNPYPRPLKIMKNQTLAFGSSPAKINVSREREVEKNEEPRFQINENLSPKEQKELKQVLERYGDLFSSRLGRTNLAKHRIDTEDAKPIKHKPYRVSAKERDIIKEQIDEMLTEGIIRPSSSPWSFPVILVKKRDGKYRFCVDYRKLNNVTVKDVYPIPRIDEVMDTLQGSTHFSAIDLRSGYWQVEVEERDKEKTAFTTAHGLYEFNVMPFGLCNAPATFERNMENMLGNLRWQICLCYLDDVIIYSPDFPTHLKRLEAVFRCFRESNLRLNDKKCRFAFEELEILGYITSKHGIKPAEHNIKAVRNFPRPKKVKEVQSFLGMCSYYRKFIKDFSKIADPLTNLIKKSVSFTWTERQEEAFQTLKTALLSPPILGHFNPNAPTYVHTDASNIGIGATLVQDIGGEEKVISYLSRTLSKAEQNYSTTEKECLAVVWSMSKLRPYLYGRHFKIVTDHHALCWLKNLKDPTGRLARWALKIQEYDFDIIHKSGKKHLDADGLSRGPLPETDWDEDFERLFLNQITDEEDKFIESVKKNLNGSRRSIAQNFKEEDGCLFKKNPNPEGRAWLLVVPKNKKREIMKEYHNHMSNGHLGVARTMYRIKSKYFWPSMLKDVSEFVKTCHLCQSRKGSNQLPSGLLQPIPPANFPFERIGIDFVGPLPSTKNRKKWIIVLSDYYTRYAETRAVSEATVKEVSKFLVEDIFLRHGAPQYLISDRGSQFTSNLMKEVMKTCKIKHCFTTSYHPQTNGLTERLNRTLINMLSMYVNTDQKNWDEILPFITHAYNTTIQETTGYSPFFLMFGREPTSLLDDRNISVDIDKDDYDEYIKHHLDKINRTRKLVINNTIKTQERMKKNYDKKHMERSYEPGELVAVWTPIRKIGKCEKLLRKYFGPYRILKKLSNVNYLIEPKDNPGQDPLIVHVSRIKPYFERIDEVNHEDEYNEETETFETFYERLEQFLILEEAGDEKKKAYLLTLMGSKTYGVLKNLCSPILPKDKTFDNLIDILKRHFSPKRSIVVERFIFFKRMQLKEESISDYLVEIKRLASSCNFGNFLEDSLRDKMVCGLYNAKIQNRILSEGDISLAKVIEIALSMEAAEKNTKLFHLEQGEDCVDKLRMERKVESNFQNGKCKHCGKQHKELCRFKEAICFKCNKKGHIASICWSSRRNLRQHQNQPGNIHQIGDQEEEEEYVQKIISVTIPEYKINFASSDPPYLMELKVEGNFIKFEMDTGSGLTLISEKDFKNSLQHLKLEKASIIVRTYDGTVVPILGKINVKVECQDITYKLRALVVKGEKRALMGREWINRLKLGCFAVKHMPVEITIEEILKENQALFVETTEPIKGFTFSVNMCDVNPIFHKARPVPFAIRPAVTEALDKMVAKGYLCEVASSKWATPVVVVPKKNKEIRICCDFKVTLNKYLDTAAYPLPTQQDLFSTLAKGKYFSKLDLRNAYLQLEVDPGTRPLLTINTHKGLFRFKRMPFGLANAPSYFQSVMDRVLSGIGGVICYIDDVLIATASIEEHLALLKTIFARLAKYNIKLKKEKCLFLQKEIEYLGHLVTEEGIRPLDHKVQAIQKAKTPTNIPELRSFLGLVNFYGKFIPNLPELLKPLHELLHKKRPWVWTKECGEAIDKCKNSITSERVLVPYDATLPLCLATDASQIGVGAVLSHIIEGQERPIMFASRTLSVAEQNYSQIEKEALAIIYGVTKFHQFIYGRKFILITDHKPLVTILGSRSGIPTLSTSRLQRWALILSAYTYDIKFRRTQDHGNADLLSRFPVGCEEIPRLNNVYALSYVEELPITAEEIATETEKDEVLSLAIFYTQQGWPEKVADHLRPYFQRKLELTVDGECLVWGMRVVIPPSLRIKMLNCLHETHSGMNKMKAVARSHFWWPNLDTQIEFLVNKCRSCQQSQDGPNKGKWQPWKWSTRPWQRIHIDFANKKNINLLIVVDSHSKWIEAIPMRETTTRKTIEQLRRLFSSYGLPEELVSDNGPQFTGSEMKGFLEGNGIKQTLIPAYHPQSNGLAERAVRTIKTALDKNKRKIGDTIQDTLSKVLLAYRSTPHVTTGKTPSELFIGRALRTRVSLIHPSLASRVRDQQARQMKYDRRTHLEEFQIDDLVWCKNFRGGDKWIPGKIVGKKGTRVYTILIHGQVKAYHRDQIRKRWRNGEEDESGDGERQPEHSRGAGPSAIISEVVRDRGYMESLSPGLTSQRSDQDSEVQSDTDDGKSLEPLRSLDPEALKEEGPVLRRNPPRARRPPVYVDQSVALTRHDRRYHLPICGVGQLCNGTMLRIKSAEVDMSRAMWISLPLQWALILTTTITGLLIYARYADCDPVAGRLVSAHDQAVYSIHSIVGGPMLGVFTLGMCVPIAESKMIPEMKERYIRYLERIVSLNPPTPAEVTMSRDLENYLKNDGCYLTDEDNQKREMVLEQLRKISKEWIRKMGRQQLGLEANGRLSVFGSYGMGLKSSGSDIDAILIGPKFVTRDHFFSSFVEELQGHPWIKSINPIPNARVPILKTEWKFGVEVDILYAAINLNSVPENEDVECQERYRGIDEVSRLSLGGVRAMHAIKKAVSNWDEYVLALNAVKHWAKLRGLHSSNFGYLSGITLAIMVARATQLYPKANAFVLFKKFFTMFHFNEDYWYMHVCMLYLPEEDAQWDRTTKQEDAEDAAIVLMPCYPWTNTAKKATDANVAILIKEIRNAKTIIDGFENEADWEQLFCPIKFIDLYDLFLIVSLTEVDADRLKVSKGFLESRINYLLRALETKSEFTTLHIFPKSFEAKRNPSKLIWAIGVKIDEEFKEKVDLTNELRTFLAKFHYAARKCDVTIDSSSVDIE
ncbi:K02A2.6-like, partial [Cordylochernes scorpioides]